MISSTSGRSSRGRPSSKTGRSDKRVLGLDDGSLAPRGSDVDGELTRLRKRLFAGGFKRQSTLLVGDHTKAGGTPGTLTHANGPLRF